MLYLNIASNVNILSDLVENQDLEKIIKNAYRPLLAFYRENQIPSTLFFGGKTLEVLEKEYPLILEEFQAVVDAKIVEIGGHTYGHPVISLTHTRDLRKHMEYSQELEKRIFGSTARGFLPPEWVFDVTIPGILKEYNMEWMLLLGVECVGYYNQTQKEVFQPGKVLGSANVSIPTIFVYDDQELWFRNNLFNMFIGIKDPEEFARETYERIAPNIDLSKDQMLIFYFDLETPAFNYRKYATHNPCTHFFNFIKSFMEKSAARPIGITEFLASYNQSLKTIHPVLTRTYKDFDIWWQGSQKLDLESSRIRELVWKIDDYVPEHYRIHELWKTYLLSQSSDARAAASDQRAKGLNISGHNIYFGKRERVLEAYNHLMDAERIAKEILEDYENR